MEVPEHPDAPVRPVDILSVKVDADTREQRSDLVAVEAPIHILVNGDAYATIRCTPQHLEALSIGHLVSEGIVPSYRDIDAVGVTRGDTVAVTLRSAVNLSKHRALSAAFKRLVHASRGSIAAGSSSTLLERLEVPVVEARTPIRASTILESLRHLNRAATTFRATGGVHAAAIYNRDGTCTAFAEDVGRHNAVDKVIGSALTQGHGFDAYFLAFTGRLTGDVVLKAARVQLPLMASMAAAIDSGIEVANRAQLTLIGFVRGNRMNIYTCPERVLL